MNFNPFISILTRFIPSKAEEETKRKGLLNWEMEIFAYLADEWTRWTKLSKRIERN